MNNYVDRYGRWHDKPCVDGEPSSNNGWVYTAYAQKLGLYLDWDNLLRAFKRCHQRHEDGSDYYLRTPLKSEPPISRDEILGMVSLNLVTFESIVLNKWSFSPYVIPKFNPFKTLAALWRMRNAHRNALWENGGEPHLFRFAFSMPISDRIFFLKKNNMKVPKLYKIIEFISNKVSKKSNSSELLDWLKTDVQPSSIVFLEYFGEDHPFFKKVLDQTK